MYAFGALVAVSILAGSALLSRRCRSRGLDPDLGTDLLFYVLIPGFLAAHLYAVLAYFPREAWENPLLLLKVWENISSFGGFAGGLFGLWLFFRRRGADLPAGTRWRYLDAVAYVFPFAWIIGRLACTVAHDHPGTVTTFPLAVSLKTAEARAYIASAYQAAGRLNELPAPSRLAGMGFHDLGFYEFLYTLLVIAPAFLVLDRRPRPPGFYPIAFLLLYVPVRFALDFLRLSDARYLGLTPAQHAGIAVFALAVWGLRFLRARG
ncbi:MAG: prolipoprotein diacylglyceryl transferase [Deltaproteobacteria bacterium]|nr:prolipoprotein diacylglyceryl transferase [Deltaproteobacteria bacterium]